MQQVARKKVKLKWMFGEIQVESPHTFAIRGFVSEASRTRSRTSSGVHPVTFPPEAVKL
jgi:hypothetical protein